MRPSRTGQPNLIQTLKAWLASTLILCLLVASSPFALAQQAGSLTQHLNDTGLQMGRDAMSVAAPPAAFPGTDRPDTGSFMMSLPLVELAGRGLNVKLNLNYDSSLYQLDTDQIRWFVKGTEDNPQYPSRGFMLGYGMLIDHNVDTKCSMFELNGGGPCPSSPAGVSYYGGLTFIDETGAKHRFDNGVAVDGSDIRFSIQNGARTITYPDGTTYVFGAPFIRNVATWRSPTFQYINTVCYQQCTTNDRVYFPVKINDRNGNFITIVSSGLNITKITDTLGREINFNYDQSQKLTSIDVPGFTPGTRREVVRFFYRTYTVTWNFRDQTPSNTTYTFSGLESLYFPGTKSGWHFDYSSYGQIWLVQNLLGMEYDAASNTLTSLGTEIARTSYSYNGTPLNPNTSLLFALPNYTQRIDEWLSDPSDPAKPKMRTVHKFALDTWSEINLKRSISYIEAPNGVVNVIRKRYYKAEDHSVDWSKTWDEGVTLEEKAQIGSKVLMQVNNNWEKTPNGARLIDKTITNDIGQQRKTVYRYYNPNDPSFPGVRSYMNLRETLEYGFDGALLRRTVADYVRDGQWTDKWLIKLPKKVQVFEGNSMTPASQVDFEYDTEPLISYPEMIDNLSMMFDSKASLQRGNVTKVTSYSNAANPAQGITVSMKTKYDIVGNAVEKTDGNDKVAQVEYSADYRRTFPTKVSSPIPDTSGANGSMQPLVKKSTYNFNTGLAIETRDENDQPTTYDYNDPINRLKKVSLADGGSISYIYSNSPQEISVCTVVALDNSRSTQGYQFYNGRGWDVRKQVLFGDGTYSTVDKEYDDLGRLSRVSNPYIAGLNGTLKPNPDNRLWTTTSYDLLWRVTGIRTPDNAEMKTEYEGPLALATDQAGRQRVSKSDEFGRITDVWEVIPTSPDDPNAENVSFTNHPEVSKGYHTSYRYDVLNNLRQVQQGVQKRFFYYDSLSKLTAMKLPEQEVNTSINYTDPVTANTQWSMGFDYDGNGNMRHSRDARGVLTTYSYDSLNRLISRSHANDPSDTPTATYRYDSAGVSPVIPNSASRLTSVSTSGRFVSSYSYDDYDPMGRVRKSTATIESSPPYVMRYAYDLAGNMVSQTYPSERVVITEIDDAGRVGGLRKQSSNDYYAGGAPSTNGGRNIQYTAHGAIRSLPLGNGLWETSDFSDLRLQLMSLKQGTTPSSANRLQIDYGYGTQNNGNLRSQTITVPTINAIAGSTFTQSYDYDWLNRLKVISEPGGPTQSYDYDQYGNRAVVAGTVADPQTPQQLSVYEAATNRLKTKEYDKSGNITREGLNQGHSYQFDAENHLYTVDGGAAATFNYDGNGHRVKKVTPAGTVLFVYNAMDQLVAEYGGATPPGTGGTSYYTLDESGTPRAVTGPNINDASGGIKARHDYLPFGEEMGVRGDGQRNTNQGYVGSNDNVRQKFTGYERDAESGLDYAQARYYGSTQGRFTSVDPSMTSGRVGDPQTWNRYAYTLNNPLKFVDPSGTDWGYSENSDGSKYFRYFHGDVPREFEGRTWQAVVFGPDGTLEVTDKQTGDVYRISNDPDKGLEIWLRKDPNITPKNDWDPSCANCKALVDELGGKWGPPVEKSIKGMMAADVAIIGAPYIAEYLGAFGYDKVLLWSGEGAQAEGEAIAMEEGAWVLNATRAGAQAEAEAAGLEWSAARPIFMRASDLFTRDLTGKIVHVVLRNPAPNSIYAQVEVWNLTYSATWRSIVFH